MALAEGGLTPRRALALSAGLLAAYWLIWQSIKAEPEELARAESGDPSATASPQASWTAGAAALSAAAGPQRFLSGDWTLAGDGPARALPAPRAEAPPAPGPEARQAHVVPVAERVAEGLRRLAPGAGEAPRRSSLALVHARDVDRSPASEAALSSAPVSAAQPPEARQAPAAEEAVKPKRRLFIPIPDPKGGGIREARERPYYTAEETPSSTTQGGPAPAAIQLEPDKAVAVLSESGDAYRVPGSSVTYDAWRRPTGKKELQRGLTGPVESTPALKLPARKRPHPDPLPQAGEGGRK